MENKEFATTKKITQELIGGWLLWGIVFGLIYSPLYAFITHSMESLVLKAIISIVMQGIITFIIWKFSTKSTFKKRTISYNDVPTVMRNLMIFTVIVCVINGIYNYFQVNSTIDEAVNSNYIKYTESMMSYLYDDDQMTEYNKQKEDAIAKAKKQARTYLVILEIGLTAIYLAVLPLEKREILKYVK